jgi:hypothetical protein
VHRVAPPVCVRLVIVVCAWLGIAGADPAADTRFHLVEFVQDGVSVRVPAGWSTKLDVKSGMLVARREPGGTATLVLTLRPSQGATADALVETTAKSLVRDLAIRTRDALPSGARAIVGDGSYAGVKRRIAAVAVVGNGLDATGVLAAADIDALGGVQMIAASLASIHRVSDDILRAPAPVGRADIVGSWRGGTAYSVSQVDAAASSATRNREASAGHYDANGDVIDLVLRADAAYKLVHTSYVSGGAGCINRSTGTETGTYTFDRRALVLTPKQAAAEIHPCSSLKGYPQKAQLTAPRRYEAALDGGALILVGPRCSSDPNEVRCGDHERLVFRHGQ